MLPLIDGRLWYGLPAQGGKNYTDPITGRFYPDGKPDRTNVLFGDWDHPNIIGLKPPEMLMLLIVPSVLGWVFASAMQVGYTYFIAEAVIGLKWPDGREEDVQWCFGARDDVGFLEIKTDDLLGARMLRALCNITFVLEVLNELFESWHYHEWINEVPTYQRWVPPSPGNKGRKGHGMTWKYQEYTNTMTLSNGQVVETTVIKPYTGITKKYRAFVYFVILVKVVIAVLLGIYGLGFIYFTESTEDIILNTLAVFFVFTIDDLVYRLIAPKIAHAAFLNAKRHIFSTDSFVGTNSYVQLQLRK